MINDETLDKAVDAFWHCRENLGAGIGDSDIDVRAGVRAALESLTETADKVLSGPPLSGEEIVARLERRMGSMKMVGERDDLLLDAAVFIARSIHQGSERGKAS